MKRSKAMEELLDMVGKDFGFQSRRACEVAKRCVSCGGDATKFTDELSEREYGISGFCQKCQDGIFGDPSKPKEGL